MVVPSYPQYDKNVEQLLWCCKHEGLDIIFWVKYNLGMAKSRKSGYVIPVVVGAVAAAFSYLLFKDNIDPQNKYKKTKKMARYPKIRKKGRPKGMGSQTERIKKLLSIISEKKEFALSDIRYRFPSVTERTLRRDLRKLERDGKVKRKGSTRSTIYFR